MFVSTIYYIFTTVLTYFDQHLLPSIHETLLDIFPPDFQSKSFFFVESSYHKLILSDTDYKIASWVSIFSILIWMLEWGS